MKIRYATKWVEGEHSSDVAAYHGRILGIEILNTLLPELNPTGGYSKAPLDLASFRYMEVLPYSHLLLQSGFGDVELTLKPEMNQFIDYTMGDSRVYQYRSAVTIKGKEKTLEQLAGVLEKYKDKKVG